MPSQPRAILLWILQVTGGRTMACQERSIPHILSYVVLIKMQLIKA